MKNSSRWGLKIVSIIVALVASYDLCSLFPVHSLGQSVGGLSSHSSDFIQYWSAYQLWLEGLNPYIGINMLAVQSPISSASCPLMMWNPPWLLLLMKPILGFSYDYSSVLWFSINALLLFLSIELALRIFACTELRLLLFGLSTLFLPTHSSMSLGQLGVLLLFGCTLFLYGKVREQDLVSGLGVALCSVKPHLFSLTLMVMVWECLAKRNYAGLFFSLLPSTLLVVLTSLIDPMIILSWTESLSCKSCASPAPSVLDWITPNLPYLVRVALQPTLSGTSFAHPGLMIMLFPFILMFLVLALLIRFRPKINWLVTFGPLLAFSTYVAPFGWVFDQTVLGLFICQILAEARLSQTRFRVALVLILVWEMILMLWELNVTLHSQYPPSGPALLAIWIITKNIRSNDPAAALSKPEESRPL